VLSGRGKAFCAGLDWGAFLATGGEASAKLLERGAASPANLAQRACWIWQELDVPVLAAIRGVAFGGGLQLALAADLRFVAPDAQLSVMEIRYGLVPDMTATKTLAALVRPDVARELTWTGRIVGAYEAVTIGLATRREEDPIAAALATAREIAKRSPHAIRAGKKLLRETAPIDAATAFRRETELQLALLGSPNQMEAAMAVMGKREPTFADP
jgi:enoyl-CoA hydratase/carnithine racemase